MQNNKIHKLPILFKNNIKSLPSGVRDVFVLDSINQKAFIIFNIGRVIFSGAEDWKLIYHNNNYATYFLKQEYVHVVEDDNSTQSINEQGQAYRYIKDGDIYY